MWPRNKYAVKELWTDDARELKETSEFGKQLLDDGVEQRKGIPRRPKTRARQERRHQEVYNCTRASMVRANGHLLMWGFAPLHCNTNLNLVPPPPEGREESTRHEAYHGVASNVTPVPWGCQATFYDDTVTVGQKFNPRAIDGVVLGYGPLNSLKVGDLSALKETGRTGLITTRDVVVDPNVFPMAKFDWKKDAKTLVFRRIAPEDMLTCDSCKLSIVDEFEKIVCNGCLGKSKNHVKNVTCDLQRCKCDELANPEDVDEGDDDDAGGVDDLDDDEGGKKRPRRTEDVDDDFLSEFQEARESDSDLEDKPNEDSESVRGKGSEESHDSGLKDAPNAKSEKRRHSKKRPWTEKAKATAKAKQQQCPLPTTPTGADGYAQQQGQLPGSSGDANTPQPVDFPRPSAPPAEEFMIHPPTPGQASLHPPRPPKEKSWKDDAKQAAKSVVTKAAKEAAKAITRQAIRTLIPGGERVAEVAGLLSGPCDGAATVAMDEMKEAMSDVPGDFWKTAEAAAHIMDDEFLNDLFENEYLKACMLGAEKPDLETFKAEEQRSYADYEKKQKAVNDGKDDTEDFHGSMKNEMPNDDTDIIVGQNYAVPCTNFDDPAEIGVMFGGIARAIPEGSAEAASPMVLEAEHKALMNLVNNNAVNLDDVHEESGIKAVRPDALFVNLKAVNVEKYAELLLPEEEKVYKSRMVAIGCNVSDASGKRVVTNVVHDAPINKYEIRVLVAYALTRKKPGLRGADVVGAYLKSKLGGRPVYGRLPRRF